MSSEENNVTVTEKLSLSEFLEPDTPEILEIKSLLGEECKYIEYLISIEYSIAHYYHKIDRKIEDKDITLLLKNIKKNYDKNISSFEHPLELLIVRNLVEALHQKPITHREFKLVLDYFISAIDNRSWLDDKQAYLKWLAHALNYFTEEEEKEYVKNVAKVASKLGLSDEEIGLLLLKESEYDYFEEDSEEKACEAGRGKYKLFKKEARPEKLRARFNSMSDAEKIEFLVEYGSDYFNLVESYINELVNQEKFEKVKELYNKIIEKDEDFLPLHFMMGIIFLERDPALAKFYFEQTLKVAKMGNDVPEDILKNLELEILALEAYLSEEKQHPRKKMKSGKKKHRQGFEKVIG
jgi:hypothetical protein